MAVLLAGICWFTIAAPEARAQVAREISTFQQFYDLSNNELAKGRTLRLRAFVLCYDSGWNQAYFHDGNQVGYFAPKTFRTQPQRGQEVEITGLAALVDGNRVLTNLDLKILGPGTAPPAKRLELPQLGSEFGQWIEVSGRVRTADTSLERLALTLHAQGQSCLVYVMGPLRTKEVKGLLDCTVRLRGINGSKVVKGRLESAQITVPDFDEVQVLDQPKSRPLLLPVVSIGSLLNRELGPWTNNRVHINGVIEAYRPGEYLIVKDPTGAIRAQVVQSTPAQPDGRVDVWGFLTVSPEKTVLSDASFEVARPPPSSSVVSPASRPAPNPVSVPQVLTRVSDVRRLPRDVTAQRIPVRLQGVVTYSDPEWRTCFFQDESGGIYVDPGQQIVSPGQRAELTGETDSGGYAPQVIHATFQVLGKANWPAPAKVGLDGLADGHLDAQWVELQGVVRRLIDQSGHLYLIITTPKGKFKALLPGLDSQQLSSPLVDAQVSVQGACTSELNAKGQLIGIVLNVPTLDFVRILDPPPADPFEGETVPIASVATFQPERPADRRIKVAGVVTLEIPGQGFYLQDTSGGIHVVTLQTNEIRLGDRVEVRGFPALAEFSPYLEDVTLRKQGSGPLPSPIRSTAEQILLYGTNDATVVELEAQLLQNVRGSANPQLVLQEGPIIFTAHLGNRARGKEGPALTVGSRLRLTGVCAIQAGESREPKAFHLLLRQPDDIKILATPPWWTPRHTVLLASGMALAIMLTFTWAASLRKTVRRQTEIIRRKLEIEEALEQRFRELFENANDLLFTFDSKGKCTSLNRAAEQFFGFSREQALEKRLGDLVMPEFRGLVEEKTRQVLASHGVAQLELKANRGDGTPSVLELSLRVILQDGRPIGLQGTGRDITERRELESQLRQAQKMESIGQLAAGVAHDFNNILTVIQGHCGLLLEQREGSIPPQDSLREISAAAARAATLTRHLLMFSRKQPLRLTRLDLNKLISNLAPRLHRLLGEDVELECGYRPDLPPVLADAGTIEQVIVNLSLNARDAMPSGGRLAIRTEAENLDANSAQRNPESRPGLFVTLTVEDTGHGMDGSTMKHLFEPFFTTKDVGKGTGLGLASVYGIVKQHEGWVEVTSQPQVGTRVTVFLPTLTNKTV